jgi:hypothetical protein
MINFFKVAKWTNKYKFLTPFYVVYFVIGFSVIFVFFVTYHAVAYLITWLLKGRESANDGVHYSPE